MGRLPKYTANVVAYLGFGAACSVISEGTALDFSSACFWVWLFGWPFVLLAKIVWFLLMIAIILFGIAIVTVAQTVAAPERRDGDSGRG